MEERENLSTILSSKQTNQTKKTKKYFLVTKNKHTHINIYIQIIKIK